jgi:hypothetical protein
MIQGHRDSDCHDDSDSDPVTSIVIHFKFSFRASLVGATDPGASVTSHRQCVTVTVSHWQ